MGENSVILKQKPTATAPPTHPCCYTAAVFLPPPLPLPLPSPSVSLAPASLSRPMCIDGSGMQEPPGVRRRRAVPLFPEFFVVVLHCSAPLVYSIVRLIVRPGSPAPGRLLESGEPSGGRLEGGGGGGGREQRALCPFAHYSPAFPSVSLSSFLFLWDSRARLVIAQPRLLIGEVMVGKYDGAV